MELFTALLSSEHPEESLFGSPRGMVEERDATLRGGAPIRWKLDEAGGLLPNHRALISERPIKYIRAFSDDGESEWINVLVPGYGRCQVQRADLIFGCNSPREASKSGITSLSIRFNSETEVAEGLPQLLAAVGGSLTTLSLIGRRELVGDDLLLRCCPNLLELSISGDVVKAQLDFREYQKRKKELPSIICNWHDVAPLSTALMDSGNALTQCLRRLRVRLANPYRTGAIPDGYDPENYESDLDAVLKMLEVNRSLEFLEVTVPSLHQAYISKFTLHDKNPIDRALRLPMETKPALLSVVERCRSLRPAKERKYDVTASNSALCKLDHLALSTIFAFTAPPVLRRVACRSVRDS